MERVTYHDAENGFRVLRAKVRGHEDLVTVVGHAAGIAAGEWGQISGTWVDDRTHGPQFRAAFPRASPPTTIQGVERYLGSGTIRGVGPVHAKKRVAAPGEAVLDLIEGQPDRRREVTGIGPERPARIVAGRADQKVIREVMLFLHTHGVGTARAVRIFETRGGETVRIIAETRGKRLVVLVGQRRAPGIAVRNRNTRRRWSKLGEWLDAHHSTG